MHDVLDRRFCCPRPCDHKCAEGPPLLTRGGSSVGCAWLHRPLLGAAPWDAQPPPPPRHGRALALQCREGCIGPSHAGCPPPADDDTCTSVDSEKPTAFTPLPATRVFLPPPPMRQKLPQRCPPEHECPLCKPSSTVKEFRCRARDTTASKRDLFRQETPSAPEKWWEGTKALRPVPEPEPPQPWMRRPYINVVGAVADAGWVPSEAQEQAVETVHEMLREVMEQATPHQRKSLDDLMATPADYVPSSQQETTETLSAEPCEPCKLRAATPRTARDIWRKLTKK